MKALRQSSRWFVAGTTALMVFSALALNHAGPSSILLPVAVTAAAALITPVVVALLILQRYPRHLIGWIMLLGPLPVAFIFLAEEYSSIGVASGSTLPAQAVVAIFPLSLWPAFYVWPLAIAFLFPDGHLPSPRWRPAAASTFAAAAVVSTLILLGENQLPADKGGGPNPLRIQGIDALLPVFWLAWGLMFAGLFLGVAAVIVRFRRSLGAERLQLKWLAWSAALIPLGLLVCAGSYLLFGGVEYFVPIVLLATGVLVSVSVGIAISRHGLYEIDRVINRTLVYALVTVVLGLGVVATAIGAGLVLGQGSVLATAVATFVVTIAFRPVRSRAQATVDRHFAQESYVALRQVSAFEDAVRRGAAGPEEVGDVLAEALGDESLSLLLRLPHSGDYISLDGERVGPPSSGIPVIEAGEELARLVYSRAAVDPDLVRRTLRAVALPIEIARWRAEARVQLGEVEASRQRILTAGDQERRRLERDLHDGAQQRLVALGVALRRIELSLPPEARVLVPAVDQAVEQVSLAIADLRTIASGLRPPRLDDGLKSAVEDLARSAPLPVDVKVDADDLPSSIELAAYYAICEGVTNAVKHASASSIQVQAVRMKGSLEVTIRDDGAGGATVRSGGGLTGIADRVAAHGGRMSIESADDAGTQLTVGFPCDS